MYNRVTTYFAQINLTPRLISRIAICAALVLAPLMVSSAAYLVDSQMSEVKAKHAESVQTKAATKVALSREDSAQIAQAIALANNG